VLILFAGVTWRWQKAENSRAAVTAALAQAAGELAVAEQSLYQSRIGQANDLVRSGQFVPAADLLRRCLPPPGRPDQRGWEWHYLQRFCFDGRDPVSVLPAAPEPVVVTGFRGVTADALSPDRRRSATIADKGRIVIRDTATRLELLTLAIPLPASEASRPRLVFSEDGLRLSAAWDGGTAVWDASPGATEE
jgi:hypothetical protein